MFAKQLLLPQLLTLNLIGLTQNLIDLTQNLPRVAKELPFTFLRQPSHPAPPPPQVAQG